MPDPTARKRLKKKMLERWENEGGRLGAEPTSADEKRPTSKTKREGKESLVPGDSGVRAPASLTKRLKATGK